MQNRTVIALGRLLFLHRDWIFPLLIAALFLMRPASQATGEGVLDAAGVLAVVMGLVVRLGVIGVTPVRREGNARKVDAVDLKTTGLFAACRNPLYVGNMLIATGVFLVHGALPVVAVGIVATFLIYQAIIANEENFLSGRFGAEYDAYRAASTRWWPRLGQLRGAFAGERINIWRGLRIERTVISTAGVLLFAAFWYEAGARVPPLASWGVLICALVLVALGTAADENP